MQEKAGSPANSVGEFKKGEDKRGKSARGNLLAVVPMFDDSDEGSDDLVIDIPAVPLQSVHFV